MKNDINKSNITFSNSEIKINNNSLYIPKLNEFELYNKISTDSENTKLVTDIIFEEHDNKNSKNNKWKIAITIIILVLILCVIIIVTFYYLRKKRNIKKIEDKNNNENINNINDKNKEKENSMTFDLPTENKLKKIIKFY